MKKKKIMTKEKKQFHKGWIQGEKDMADDITIAEKSIAKSCHCGCDCGQECTIEGH